MDKQEKIRLIIEKVSDIEHENFCMGVYGLNSVEYDKHNKILKGKILSLYDLLEDLL